MRHVARQVFNVLPDFRERLDVRINDLVEEEQLIRGLRWYFSDPIVFLALEELCGLLCGDRAEDSVVPVVAGYKLREVLNLRPVADTNAFEVGAAFRPLSPTSFVKKPLRAEVTGELKLEFIV